MVQISVSAVGIIAFAFISGTLYSEGHATEVADYSKWVLRGTSSVDFTPAPAANPVPLPDTHEQLGKPWQSFQKTALVTSAVNNRFQLPPRDVTPKPVSSSEAPSGDAKAAVKTTEKLPDAKVPDKASDAKLKGKAPDDKAADKVPEAKPADKETDIKLADKDGQDKVAGVPDKATLLPLTPRRVIQPQKAMSIGAAIQKAIGRHPDIVTAQSLQGREQANVLVAKSVKYPQISFGGGVGSSFKNEKSGGSISNSVGLNAEQLVYDFGRSDNIINAAKSNEVRARLEVDVTSERIAGEVALAFVAAQRAKMLQESAEDSLASLERMRDIIKLRADSGVSDQADLVLANVRVDGAESELIGAKTAEQASRSSLISLIGINYQGLKDIDPLLDSMDRSLKRSMIDRHPGIIAAQQEVQATQYQLSAEKAAYYPSLSVGGSYQYDPGKGDTSSNIMLSVKGSLYQGGATKARIAAANDSERAARYRVDSIRLTNSTMFDVSAEDAVGAASQRKVVEQQIKRAIDSRDMFFEQYQLGKRSLTDLLNADAAIYGAINTKIEIEYRYRASIIRKAQALGVLRSRLTGA